MKYIYLLFLLVISCSFKSKAQTLFIGEHKTERKTDTIFTSTFQIEKLTFQEIKVNEPQPNINYQFLSPTKELIRINVKYNEGLTENFNLSSLHFTNEE